MDYHIVRTSKEVRVEVLQGRRIYPLVPVGTHGNQFEYGFRGSGPATLAQSILANWFAEVNLMPDEIKSGDFLSCKLHYMFKEEVIAVLDQEANEHYLLGTTIQKFLDKKLQPLFSLHSYRQRREVYRTAVRYRDNLEEQMGGMEFNEDMQHKWSESYKPLHEYWAWLANLIKE